MAAAVFRAPVPSDQRMHYKITPMPGQLMTAKHVGEQIAALSKLLEKNFEKQDDGKKWRVAVSGICTEDDGSIIFDLILAPLLPKAANPSLPEGDR